MYKRITGRMARKWLVLLLFIGAFFVVTYSDAIDRVLAMTPCYQACEGYRNQCYDDCNSDCSTGDTPCTSCVSDCDSGYASCMAIAHSCPNDPPAQPGQCELHFGLHCPIINGNPDCQNPGAHNGYWLICPSGAGSCTYCPPGEWCASYPPC